MRVLSLSLAAITALCSGAHALLPPAPLSRHHAHHGHRPAVFDSRVHDLPHAAPQFDFYVLAVSWQPEFCHGKEQEYPGCTVPRDYWRSHFTMHGLWPEREHGKHPGFCHGPEFDPAAVESAVGLDNLMQFWPNVKIAAGSADYVSFWRHEWTRHGTCSGLEQAAYFSRAVDIVRNATLTTPQLVQQNVGKSVSASELRAAFKREVSRDGDGDVALKCDHGNHLSQAFTCWEKDAKNQPIRRRACPPHIVSEDTCRSETVEILAFP
ncbi:hypothetical protein P43SY_002017 [Pythium insidiosum]|uniref:Uncharacterized protein n=1 Tax=Pythium insidiosum TaxID=114742 RepID=A0AAD5LC45_PYTIN|nr:hypothetical protein P43SY_002017 [Pythium insidiosum]